MSMTVEDDPVAGRVRVQASGPGVAERVVRWRGSGVDDEITMHCLACDAVGEIIRRRRNEHRHVFIACLPGSGSTFLHRLLLAVTGFTDAMLVSDGLDDEEDVQRSCIPDFLASDSLARQHARATAPTIELLGAMNLRPIVLVRNVFDTLVSIRDHFATETVVGPIAQVPRSFPGWDGDRQMSLVISMCTPWILSFVSSWIDAGRTLPLLWITYDDVVDRTEDTVGRVLAHSAVHAGQGSVGGAIATLDPADERLNHGVSGRGVRTLNPQQQSEVRRIAAVYRSAYDFSSIGL
jgi:hypothetical protein